MDEIAIQVSIWRRRRCQKLLTFPKKSGYLLKQGEFHRSWKKRWFELSGKKLTYYKTEETKSPQGSIPLEDSALYLPSENSSGSSIIMYLVVGSRLYQLKAKTEDERDSWANSIMKCSRAYRENLLLEKAEFEITSTEILRNSQTIHMQNLNVLSRRNTEFLDVEMATIRNT